MKKIAFTTSQKTSPARIAKAQSYAAEFGLPYVERGKYSLRELSNTHGIELWLIVAHRETYAVTRAGEQHFYLNMAELRIREWRKAGRDYLTKIVAASGTKRFLDATFGIGSDSITLAATLPSIVTFTALEKEVALYILGKLGLRSFVHAKDQSITAALRKIHLEHASALDFLRAQPENAFDTVYFDFMFRRTVSRSTNLSLLRHLGSAGQMTSELWQEVERVAAIQIVLKDRPFGRWFRERPPTRLVGGTYSRVAYGVWECRKKSS